MHIPYHKSLIGGEEIAEVNSVLRSGWLTSGPKVREFEMEFAAATGATHALALNSCTAGLNLALRYLDLKPGDEVITSPYSFVAASNAIVNQGGKVVFADVVPATLNINPVEVRNAITPRTRAVLAVHLGGNPCEMEDLVNLCSERGIPLIEDCAHSLGGSYDGRATGTFGFAGIFSFYPTKNITAAEGGMLITNDTDFSAWVSQMRKHGMNMDTWERQDLHEYRHYDVTNAGWKCNMTDVQAAIGLWQLRRLGAMQTRRHEITGKYDEAFGRAGGLRLIQANRRGIHSRHLYILQIVEGSLKCNRDELIRRIQKEGIMLSVNYTPVHLFSWYRKNYGFKPGDFPNSEKAGANTFSIPIYPALTNMEVDYVIGRISRVVEGAG